MNICKYQVESETKLHFSLKSHLLFFVWIWSFSHFWEIIWLKYRWHDKVFQLLCNRSQYYFSKFGSNFNDNSDPLLVWSRNKCLRSRWLGNRCCHWCSLEKESFWWCRKNWSSTPCFWWKLPFCARFHGVYCLGTLSEDKFWGFLTNLCFMKAGLTIFHVQWSRRFDWLLSGPI